MKRLASVGVIVVAAIILAAFLFLFNAEACTRMFWNSNGQVMLVARNLDLDLNDLPTFYVFPKGMNKNGGAITNPARWTSRYGSMVMGFQRHRYFCSEGINTSGLAYHYLYLTDTKYEDRDGRPGVLMGRYGEYLLDNAATVSDALLFMYKTQLVPQEMAGRIWPQHIALEDASGDSAIIEFVGGRMYVYHGAEYTVLTNDPTFDQQNTNLWHYQYFGGSRPLPGDLDAKSRFVRASAFVSSLNSAFSNPAVEPDPIASLSNAIRSLTEPFGAVWFLGNTPISAWPTLWTSLYDLTNKRVYFTHNLARNDFWIDMKKFNFLQGAPILYLNADKRGLAGEVSGLFKPL